MFSIRTIDTFEYISVLRELVESGHEVCVKVSGYSMYPFLRSGRDTAFFRKPDRKLRVGDIVFYQRLNGQYILHRICEIDNSACTCSVIASGRSRVLSYPSRCSPW